MDETCKENDELEEGECSDQDDVGMSIPEVTKPSENFRKVETAGVYRQACIPQIVINSDQSDPDTSDDDDDDDFYHAQGKKTCRYPSTKDEPFGTSNTFVNPLRTPGMAEAMADGAQRKRKNNVWGAVMTEQILSQDIKQFGVNASLAGGYRDVESYDYTIAKEDDRPDIEIPTESTEGKEDIFGDVVDLEKEVRRQQNRKRKRNAKERLGKHVKQRLGTRVDGPGKERLGPLNVTENDDPDKVTQAIIDGLEEQNMALFGRIVESIGKEKAIDLYNKTVDVESVGGMMTNNGFRRRTPGGVYIQLMKNEPSIPKDVQSAIFEQDNQRWIERKKELRKVKTAARKKWKKKEKRLNNLMDYDRPETPTPTKELEELENGNDENEVEADVDVGDLPDRPDTPEPKDSSDNVSEGEEDDEGDEEDIAVVIAKAKAAILKKQKEMAKGSQNNENDKIDEDESVGVTVDESVEML